MLLYLLTACLQSIDPPNVGECAAPPEGLYDFGQIGIGNCLSGPTDLKFTPSNHLVVANANPFQNFSSGSLLSMDWEEIITDLENNERVLMHELDNTAAMDIPSFSSDFAMVDEGLAMVAVKESEGARTRVNDDDLWLIEIDSAGQMALGSRGDNNGPTVQVGSDPSAMAISNSEGYAFVGNRTDHTISIVDITNEKISVVSPWGAAAIPNSDFIDSDGSGSLASLGSLSQITQEMMLDPTQPPPELRDDVWHLKWIEGSYRIWTPESDGWRRQSSSDGKSFLPSLGPLELNPSDGLLTDAVQSPVYIGNAMLFVDDNEIQEAVWNGLDHKWTFTGSPLFSTDSTIYGIAYVMGPQGASLFYTIQEENLYVLKELRETSSGWMSQNDPILSSESILGAPTASYDAAMGIWTIAIGVDNGDKWTIEAYTSTDFDVWTQSEARGFEINGVDVASPILSEEPDRYRMWYAFRESDVWDIGYAESQTGTDWTDYGRVIALEWDDDMPPRPACSATPTTAFRVEGDQAGVQVGIMEVTQEYRADDYAWIGAPLAGQWADIATFGAASSQSIQLDSIDEDTGLAWLTVTDKKGLSKIAVAKIDTNGNVNPLGFAISPDDDFDAEGAEAPIVWRDDNGFQMLYSADNGQTKQIASASSMDGLEWTKGNIQIEVGTDWDNMAVYPDDIIQDGENGLTLWYSGFNGSSWRIGTAQSTDGLTWTKTGEPALLPGAAGEFDDAAVRDALIVTNDGITTLLYSGFDGSDWRIGAAIQDETGVLTRITDPQTQKSRIVIDKTGLFYADGVRRIRRLETEFGQDYAYVGIFNDTMRLGRAWGEEPHRLRPLYRALNNGDELQFETQKGDSEANAIDLDIDIESMALTGVGLTALHYNEDRGMLFATSKLLPYIIVIDVRDDSTEDFDDKNVMDIEAVYRFSTSSGAVGFRETLAVGDKLYALNDSPESVFVIDLSVLEDNAYSDIYRDNIAGWLPAPRGSEEDKGVATRMNIGPGKMTLHPDGKRLFVSHFNANTVSMYDTQLGPNGMLMADINIQAENPYAMTISPDEKFLIVASYAGEMSNDTAHSILSIIDIDSNSAEYLEVIGKVVNR